MKRRHAVQGLVVGVPLVVLEDAVGLAAGAGGIAGDQVFDGPLDLRPVGLEPRIVRMIECLAVGLEDAARVAVGERLLAGRSRRRGNVGAVVDPAVGPLLVVKVDPPHLFLEVGKEPGQSLLISPDVRAGGLAAAVGTFPAVDVAIGDPEDDADVPDDGGLGGQAVEQPVGQRAVVERLPETLGLLAERGQVGCHLAQDRRGVGPDRGVVTAHPRAGLVVLVGVVPGQQEGNFHRRPGIDHHARRHGAVDRPSRGSRHSQAARGQVR